MKHHDHSTLIRNVLLPGWLSISTVLWAGDPQTGNSVQSAGPVTPLPLSFTDITASSGIDASSEGPHGSFWADVNNDGKVDFYITTYINGSNSWDKFYLNQTSGSTIFFQTQIVPARDYDGGSHGACWADLDNDGDYDLLNGGTVEDKSGGLFPPEENAMYINDGTGAFTDQTPTAMATTKKATRAILAYDGNGDGNLEVFAVNGYLGTWDNANGIPNEVYTRNTGSSVPDLAITAGQLRDVDAGQGSTDCDVDNDGDIDIIGCNRNATTNRIVLMKNDAIGSFALMPAAENGVPLANNAGDGITFGDVDNDGDFDMITADEVTDLSYFYWNNTYNPLSGATTLFSYPYVSWSTLAYSAGLADLDNDGDLDLIFSGHSNIYKNDGNGSFTFGEALTYSSSPSDPRSVAFADVDNDGDIDFAMGCKGATVGQGKTYLFRNDLSSTNHFLKVKLIAPSGEIGALGSKVYVTPVNQGGIYPKRLGNLPQIGLRQVQANFGFMCQSDPIVHFGLASNTSVDVVVEYTNGMRATRTNVAADQTITIGPTADVQVAVKLFLEGPYNTTSHTMNTNLNSAGYLQTTSPYDNRVLPEGVPSSNIVDWVYIQLRETASEAAVASKSALLRNDGMVVADDGVTEYIYMNPPKGSAVDYYIVVNHRNHLKVMSSASVGLSYSSSTVYNFSNDKNNYYGTKAKLVESGIYAMYAGDGDNDTYITAVDANSVWQLQNGTNGYKNGDFDLDTYVTAVDVNNYWQNNNGIGSGIP